MPFTSIVWSFFYRKADTDIVECKLCHHQMKRVHRSTTNLTRHVKTKHPFEFEIEEERRRAPISKVSASASSEAPIQSQDKNNGKRPNDEPLEKTDQEDVPKKQPKMAQQTLQQVQQRKEKYPTDDTRKHIIDDLIINMIIRDTRPFSIVEDQGFLALINYLNPRYDMIARSTIRDKRLPALYNLKKDEIKKELMESQSVAVTTDSWTSISTQSYTTITAHYIDKDWVQKSKVLYTRSNGKRHTSENLEAELRDCLIEFGIDSKVDYIVTDNANNITKAANDLKTQHPCLAHTINLAVKDALKETGTQELVSKVKAIVAFFKKSPKQTEKLKEIHKANKTQFKKLKQECETRWNSTLDMLESYIWQHTEITGVLCKAGKATLCLAEPDDDKAEDEVAKVKETIETLQPMKEATQELSGESFTTLSKVLPLVTALKKKTEKQTSPLATALFTELSLRFDEFLTQEYLKISTALDPRFKSRKVEAEIFKTLKKLMPEPEVVTPASDPKPEWESKKKRSTFWSFWEEEDQDTEETSSAADLELQYYCKMPNLPRTCNPLEWWRTQSHALPELSKLARKFLCIPATSVPSERVFSKAGEIVSKRRSAIKPKHVDMLIFLNKNF